MTHLATAFSFLLPSLYPLPLPLLYGYLHLSHFSFPRVSDYQSLSLVFIFLCMSPSHAPSPHARECDCTCACISQHCQHHKELSLMFTLKEKKNTPQSLTYKNKTNTTIMSKNKLIHMKPQRMFSSLYATTTRHREREECHVTVRRGPCYSSRRRVSHTSKTQRVIR